MDYEKLNNSSLKYHPLQDIDSSNIDENLILKRENNKIKLLTYNIFLRPPPVKNNENDWKDERLNDFISLLDNFDIVCLQEMFGTFTSRRQTLIKLSSNMGFFYHYEIPQPSFFSKNIIDGGLLIISRFPIIETEFRPYTYSVLECIFGQKGCLYVKIKIKESNLIIINTHLQASYYGCSQDDWDISVEARMDQLREINEFVLEKFSEGNINSKDRFIILGDFNVDATNYKKKIEEGTMPYKLIEEYKEMIDILNSQNLIVKDLWITKYEKHLPTFGVNEEGYDKVLTAKAEINTYQTIDYIFEVYFDKNDEELKEKNIILKIDYNSFTIEKFLVKNRIYQTLSDHFGLSIDLIYSPN